MKTKLFSWSMDSLNNDIERTLNDFMEDKEVCHIKQSVWQRLLVVTVWYEDSMDVDEC